MKVALLMLVVVTFEMVVGSPAPFIIPRKHLRQLEDKAEAATGRKKMTTPELIRAAGYPAEVHEVMTKDGYILEMHRIPYGINEISNVRGTSGNGVNNLITKNQNRRDSNDGLSYNDLQSNYNDDATNATADGVSSGFSGDIDEIFYDSIISVTNDTRSSSMSGQPQRPVVYLQHCFLCSSSDWIMNTPDRALAYVLADSGYDVWMGNVRGNTYSRKHIVLNPNDRRFWRFSFNEMGKYDAPAMIDHILNVTGNDRLYFIGFSMGTTIFFTMMHHHPDYSDKVIGFVGLAPVAYTKYIRGPFQTLLTFSSITRFISLAGISEILPSSPLTDLIAGTICADSTLSSAVCQNLLFALIGPNPDHINEDFLPIILSHTPAGTSLQNVAHFLQIGVTDVFQMYDYGLFGNFAEYGQSSPPLYNLSRVTVPSILFYSNQDWISTPENVRRLTDEIPNLLGIKKAPSTYTHMDFLWGKDAYENIYRPLLKALTLF